MLIGSTYRARVHSSIASARCLGEHGAEVVRTAVGLVASARRASHYPTRASWEQVSRTNKSCFCVTTNFNPSR